MAKSDTFFIRASVTTDISVNETRQETEIDLGSYVNLGLKQSTLLKVNSVQIQYCDAKGLPATVKEAPGAGEFGSAFCAAAITTRQVPASMAADAMPQLDDDATMFTASIVSSNGNTAGPGDQGITTSDMDLAPQHLSDGYIVGVDTLYLYGASDDKWAEPINVNVLLECQLVSATQSNAVALALSQQ